MYLLINYTLETEKSVEMSIKIGPGQPKLAAFKMPQVMNLKVWRDKELSPVGPGTVFNRVTEISAATRQRVKLVNKTEEQRLEKLQKLIEQEQKFNTTIQNKVIHRLSKTLKEKKAMLQLLQKEYRFDNFITMQDGFDPALIDSKEMARHYIIESRVFNSGFNMKAMKPEVHRQIKKLDPNHKYKAFKRRLLEGVKSTNVEINRAISNSAFRRMLHDREHWRDYNFPPDHEKWTLASTQPEEARDELHERREPVAEDSHVNANEAMRLNRSTEEVKNREKSVVLEKRLARPKAGDRKSVV